MIIINILIRKKVRYIFIIQFTIDNLQVVLCSLNYKKIFLSFFLFSSKKYKPNIKDKDAIIYW